MQLPDTTVFVERQSGDRVVTETWDLADHMDTLEKLKDLEEKRIRRVMTQLEVNQENRQRNQWRADVAAGRTECSFEEFKHNELMLSI
jgi:hypothetical protein